MRVEAVESTTLLALAYDSHLRVLELEFRTGSVYRYRDVPEPIYDGLREAQSKGQYFNHTIRGRYPTERVSHALGANSEQLDRAPTKT